MNSVPQYHNLFRSKYDLTGRRDWVRLLEPDDLRVFIQIGLQAGEYGKRGGLARAAAAKRDNRGRFAPRKGNLYDRDCT